MVVLSRQYAERRLALRNSYKADQLFRSAPFSGMRSVRQPACGIRAPVLWRSYAIQRAENWSKFNFFLVTFLLASLTSRLAHRSGTATLDQLNVDEGDVPDVDLRTSKRHLWSGLKTATPI